MTSSTFASSLRRRWRRPTIAARRLRRIAAHRSGGHCDWTVRAPSGSRTIEWPTISTPSSRSAVIWRDDSQLLIVLLSEHGEVRTHRAEQLGDDGDHTFEVARPMWPFHHVAERARNDASLEPWRVHRCGGGSEDRSNPCALAHGDVVVDRTWVAVEVGRLVELEWIDEDRHDDVVCPVCGVGDQRCVAGMQRAHRGNETDASSRHPAGVGPRPHVGGGREDLHGQQR